MLGKKVLLFENASHQQLIVEASKEIIITIALDQSLIYINKAGRSLLGISTSLNLEKEKIYIRSLHPEATYEKLNQQILPQLITAGETWEGFSYQLNDCAAH